MELLACRRAVNLAKEMQVQKVMLESDSTGVIGKLLKEGLDRSAYGQLVEEIKAILKNFEDLSVRAVWHSANRAADLLAKESRVNKNCVAWLGVPPAVIIPCLALDIAEV
jgi:ribonuclease HI